MWVMGIRCLLAFHVVLETVTLFTGQIWYVDAQNIYHHGPLYAVYIAFYCFSAVYYLVQELPEKLSGWFPISREAKDRWVIGVGTGGYGALMAAQNAPDAFAGAAAVNPVLDVACLYGTDYEPKPEYLFGEKEALATQGYELSPSFQIPVQLYCDANHEEKAKQWAQNGAQITVEAVDAENLLEEAFQKYVEGGIQV